MKLLILFLTFSPIFFKAAEPNSELLRKVNIEIEDFQRLQLLTYENNLFSSIALENSKTISHNPKITMISFCGSGGVFVPEPEPYKILFTLNFVGNFETWVPIEGKSYRESIWKVRFTP